MNKAQVSYSDTKLVTGPNFKIALNLITTN
jgi:hypothetical protein